MKKIYKTIAIFCLFLFACQQNKDTKQSLFIGLLIDRTDSFDEVKNFNNQAILRLLEIEKDPNLAKCFQVASISDTRYNLTYKEYLETAPNEFENNEIERLEKIDTFTKKINQNIKKIIQEPIGLNGSYVFYALAEMLNSATKSNPNGIKKIIVLGDLAEYTPLFNGLKIETLEKYHKNPEKFMTFMDKEYPIQNATNMQVYFIHVVKNKEDDKKFYTISKLLKTYLEIKGIKVVIGSNLNL